MSNSPAIPQAVSNQRHVDASADAWPRQQPMPSALALVEEVSDLTSGLGLLIFTGFPLALPALALTLLGAALVLIPALPVAILAAPFLLARRRRRARGHRRGGRTHRRPTRAHATR